MRDDFEIAFDAQSPVRDALQRIGGAEDVSFSPNNGRLALACLPRNSIAIVDLAITSARDRPQVTMTGVAEYSSPGLIMPHGVDFLDDDTIIVANRAGTVVALRLPPNAGAGEDPGELTPIDPPPGSEFEPLRGPGSIAIIRETGAPVEVLICDGWDGSVTRHALEEDPFCVRSSDVLLRRWLDLPDGVAVSTDNRWIAVSDHGAHIVMLYERTSSLSEDSDPDCILRGALYPHGLGFSADGRHLFVADAGRPHVHVYARDGDAWHGVQHPAASLRVMSDDVFRLGRDAQSGGPKGVGIDHRGHVLTVTFENQPPAFFDIFAMLERDDGQCPDHALRLSYELEALAYGRERREARIAELLASKSFRITEPLRRLSSAWSSRRR